MNALCRFCVATQRRRAARGVFHTWAIGEVVNIAGARFAPGDPVANSGDGIVALRRADEERVLAKAAETLALKHGSISATVPVLSGRGQSPCVSAWISSLRCPRDDDRLVLAELATAALPPEQLQTAK